MIIKRQDTEPPLATSEWGWRYHHIGVPTDKVMEGERYSPGEGTRVAMIIHNGAPIELIEFK
jgi:hypothetical protein